jgi:hypothetical protein
VGGACSANGGGEDCAEVIDRKAKEERPLGRNRRRWVENIKMNLFAIRWSNMDCMAQDRDKWSPLVNVVMNLRLQ